MTKTTEITRIQCHCLEISHSTIKTFPFNMNVLIKAYVLLSRNILSVPFREKNRKRFSTFSSLISSGFD